MHEDAGCSNPCGGEPMMCRTCPDLGSTAPAPIELNPDEYTWTCFVCGQQGNVRHFDKGDIGWVCPSCGETEEIG